MNYPVLRAQAPSAPRVTVLASAALVLFTLAAGIVGSDPALAGGTKTGGEPYAVKITATRSGESITLQGSVSENKTQQILAAPKLTLDSGRRGIARSGVTAAPGASRPSWEVLFEARPEGAEEIVVEVTIRKEGDVVQRNTVLVRPTEKET